MESPIPSSDALNRSTTPPPNKSLAVRGGASKLAPVKGDEVCDERIIFICIFTNINKIKRYMGNTFDCSDATYYSSKTHCNASSTGRENTVKMALVQGKEVHDKFCFILNSSVTNSNDTWETSKHISKGDTSVRRLKNSNKQESFIQKNDEVDSIYEVEIYIPERRHIKGRHERRR